MRRLWPTPGLLLPILLLGMAAPLAAQSLDPSMLKSLQSSLGVGDDLLDSVGDNDSLSPLSGSAPTANPLAGAGQSDTIEERELRRARAQRQLDALYKPTTIERDYQRRLGDNSLRQFGYDFFRQGPPPTGSRAGALGDDYVLGIGDEVQVSFRGAVNRTQTVRIDRDGRLALSGVAPIDAAGRTLQSVRAELAAETRRTMLATDAYLAVGQVRAISIFVGGEVERPGQFQLTSLSDVATAIASAGGVRRSGSLRHVRVVRAGGATIDVDLYGLLGIGAAPLVRLADGDRVIVPVVGETVAIIGNVPRPGIYELRGREALASVVAFAGGAIRQRGARVTIGRIAANGSETMLDASEGMTAMGGDIVDVVGGSPGGSTGRVQLLGNVDNPGSRALAGAPTVAALVGAQSDLRRDTYELAAVLERHDRSSGAIVYHVVNLARELQGGQTTGLESGDRLFLLSGGDIGFLNSAAVRRVAGGMANPYPGCRALADFALLLKDATPARFNAVTRIGQPDAGRGNGEDMRGGTAFSTDGQRRPGADDSRLADYDADAPAPGARMPPSAAQMQAQTGGNRAGTDNRVPDPREQELRRQRREALCPTLFQDEPELLPVLLEHAVSVGGAVRSPGAYPVGDSVSARDLALVAGGLVVGATDLRVDIDRGDGVVAATAAPGDGVSADALSNIRIASGNDLRFSAKVPQFEATAVLVSGEVGRPGLYTIRKGETLSELLQRAGGMTALSYPYGTIFTRQSVKRQQEEGFRRTALELNNSLIAIAARSENSGGGSLTSAASLVQALSRAEASGRMVVEADPRVLQRRPDLDTTLEPGDSIFVPKRPNYVLALGDVNNPGALQFVPGKGAQAYLSEAGGALSTADRKRAFMVLPDGTAQPLRLAAAGGVPPPGSTIIVPKNIDPLYRLNIIRDVTTIVAQLATSVATVAVLATR